MDKKRIIIGLSIAAVLSTAFCTISAGNIISLLVMLAVGGLGMWEFYGLLNAGDMKASKKWGLNYKFSVVFKYRKKIGNIYFTRRPPFLSFNNTFFYSLH